LLSLRTDNNKITSSLTTIVIQDMSASFFPQAGESCSSDYNRMFIEILDNARAQRLLQFYATPAQMLQLFGITAPNVPVATPHPGDEPGAAPAAAHTAWVDHRKRYETEQDKLTTFDSKLWSRDSMSPEALEPLRNPHGIIFFNTPLERMALFTAAHSALTGADIDRMKDVLKEPFTQGGDFVAFILARTAATRSLANANAPINEHDQISSLRDAVAPCGHFTDTLTKFFADHPRPDGQRHATLATRLQDYAQNVRPHVTTGTQGYAAMAHSAEHRAVALAAQLVSERLEHQVVLQALMASRAPTRTTVPKKTGKPDKKKYVPGYCHTHGHCGHQSFGCEYPILGHKYEATIDNQMGGSTKTR
jgi:hypothetical protein